MATAVEEGSDLVVTVAHEQERDARDLDGDERTAVWEVGRERDQRGLPAKDGLVFSREVLRRGEVVGGNRERSVAKVRCARREVREKASNAVSLGRRLQGHLSRRKTDD